MRMYLSVFPVFFLLCGCTTWQKPGATEEQKLQAKYSCKKDVHQTWYWGDRIWGFTPFGLIETGAESGSLYNQCMKSKGWLHENKSEAIRVNQENNTLLLTAEQEHKKCISDLRSDPKYMVVSQHLPSTTDNKFSFYQTSDVMVPSLIESHILVDYFNGSAFCHEKYLQTINPLLTLSQKQIYAQRDIDHNVTSSELTRRKISYGEWAQRENESIDKTKIKLQK